MEEEGKRVGGSCSAEAEVSCRGHLLAMAAAQSWAYGWRACVQILPPPSFLLCDSRQVMSLCVPQCSHVQNGNRKISQKSGGETQVRGLVSSEGLFMDKEMLNKHLSSLPGPCANPLTPAPLPNPGGERPGCLLITFLDSPL